MPTQLSYAGNRLIPAPTVSINKSYQKTAEEEIVGSVFNIVITGKMLAYKGSPSSLGVWYTGSTYPADESIGDTSRLGTLLRKQQAIRSLFNLEGQQLVIQSADGSQPLKCNPRIVSVDFANDLWYQTFDYSITLEADIIYIGGSSLGEDGFLNFISSADESWTFDVQDDRAESESVPRTYRVSHTVSAKGKRFYDNTGTLISPAWKQAQGYVLPKLGFDNTIALSSGVNNLPSYYSGYNHVRNEQIDKRGGGYSVTETFLLASGNALEDFTVSTKTDINTGLTSVSIDGHVDGLETRNSSYILTALKYTTAAAKFATVQSLMLTRAQTYSGATLNITPISTTIGKNPLTGIINYSYEFNDRPANLFSTARSEVINVQDNWGIDVFAPIFVLGRTTGPVIQNLGAHKERTRSLSIELVFPIASGTITNRLYTNKPSILPATSGILQSIVTSMNPSSFGATRVNVSEQSTAWDGSRFAYNVSWVYELNQNVII